MALLGFACCTKSLSAEQNLVIGCNVLVQLCPCVQQEVLHLILFVWTILFRKPNNGSVLLPQPKLFVDQGVFLMSMEWIHYVRRKYIMFVLRST